jgi:hypothetical protein
MLIDANDLPDYEEADEHEEGPHNLPDRMHVESSHHGV